MINNNEYNYYTKNQHVHYNYYQECMKKGRVGVSNTHISN